MPPRRVSWRLVPDRCGFSSGRRSPMTMSARPAMIGSTNFSTSPPSYWPSPSVFTTTSAPSFSAASRPAWKAFASPRFAVRRTRWSTPCARATSAVPSPDPSSITSHSTVSKPRTVRGSRARVDGSVAASSKQGIWMTSFTARPVTLVAGARTRVGVGLARDRMELPRVAPLAQLQLQRPVRRVVAADRGGRLGLEGDEVLAPGPDDPLPDAAARVGRAGLGLHAEALVVVVVAVQDDLRAVVAQRAPQRGRPDRRSLAAAREQRLVEERDRARVRVRLEVGPQPLLLRRAGRAA